jgi:hypothetical protein
MMTREDIAAFSPNVLLLDGFGDDVTMFDDAILGISTREWAIYSVCKILDILVKHGGMSEEDAWGWFSFNIECVHCQTTWPASIMRRRLSCRTCGNTSLRFRNCA